MQNRRKDIRSLGALCIMWVVAALICVSCNDSCLENRNALPLAGFYSSESPTAQLAIDSLQVIGVGAPGDSVLTSGRGRISELYLPFRIDSDTTKYVFKYLHSDLAPYNIADTVTFIYSRTPRFVSAECGVSYIFDIREILTTGVMIDSVACPEGFIDNSDRENLHIYFAGTWE